MIDFEDFLRFFFLVGNSIQRGRGRRGCLSTEQREGERVLTRTKQEKKYEIQKVKGNGERVPILGRRERWSESIDTCVRGSFYWDGKCLLSPRTQCSWREKPWFHLPPPPPPPSCHVCLFKHTRILPSFQGFNIGSTVFELLSHSSFM